MNSKEKIMAFDFKKEYKEYYMPKSKPQIVDIPKANYIAVRGMGIYMSDARKVAPEKWRTVIRHPIKKA